MSLQGFKHAIVFSRPFIGAVADLRNSAISLISEVKDRYNYVNWHPLRTRILNNETFVKFFCSIQYLLNFT